jgi:16S rRNA (cytidine1402-2'-O)-methyltransferase
MQGKLILVPTPLDDESPLEPVAFKELTKACEDHDIIAIEDLKPGRRRWISWGLPRDKVDSFILYNEHTHLDHNKELLAQMKKGKNVFLLSDGGLPAFCDPGRELVDLCHKSNITVTSTPFCNSISLAVALSGLVPDKFFFAGFLPLEKAEREKELKNLGQLKDAIILMDTPYRLKRLLEEIDEKFPRREIFLGLDLNFPTEKCLRGYAKKILMDLEDFKREFIIILAPLGK